jgi:hypothetical protein
VRRIVLTWHWLFSMLLVLLSGSDYRIWHLLTASALGASLSAVAYFVLGFHYTPRLTLAQEFLENIAAFQGRVFLEQFTLDTPHLWTIFEAVTGLVIEGVCIAMLVQWFFGK